MRDGSERSKAIKEQSSGNLLEASQYTHLVPVYSYLWDLILHKHTNIYPLDHHYQSTIHPNTTPLTTTQIHTKQPTSYHLLMNNTHDLSHPVVPSPSHYTGNQSDQVQTEHSVTGELKACAYLLQHLSAVQKGKALCIWVSHPDYRHFFNARH